MRAWLALLRLCRSLCPHLLALAAALLSAPAAANVLPEPGPGDPHLQYVKYDATEVVSLHVVPGYAVTVRLGPDERIETVTVGDAAAWQIQVNRRADAFVVKPNGYAATTNLVVLTDQRSYSFTLSSQPVMGRAQPYLVSFFYALPPEAPVAANTEPAATYRFGGARTLWPANAHDDGHFTSFIWPADVLLPAVYAEDRKGELALVNGVMRDGAYVIDGVHRRYVLVRGKARASADREMARP